MSYRPTIALGLLFTARLAAADDVGASHLSGHVADPTSAQPIGGARVTVRDAAGRAHTATTDQSGEYELDVPPGRYDVEFQLGAARAVSRVTLAPGATGVVNGALEAGSGELIEIHDPPPPKVQPKALNFIKTKAPPYSDEAVDKDAWTRAWMLIDIEPDGTVSRFKFLKRPGYDLEPIAEAEIWKLQFSPALDGDDRPIQSRIIWGIEWPSNGWLRAKFGTRTRLPQVHGFPPHSEAAHVPCKGGGPLQLGSLYPTYRDCSLPDASRMRQEPWILRP